MKYKLTDQNGTVIAKGNQLDLTIRVDLENSIISILTAGLTNIACDIAGGDKFTLSFERE